MSIKNFLCFVSFVFFVFLTIRFEHDYWDEGKIIMIVNHPLDALIVILSFDLFIYFFIRTKK